MSNHSGLADVLQIATDRIRELGREPVRAAFLARSLNAVADLAQNLEARELSNAVGSSSDYEVLCAALEEPSAIKVLERADPLVRARLRGLKMRQRLLEREGPPLSTRQVSELLRISRQAVHKRRTVGRLLGVSAGRRDFVYPSWQFDDGGVGSGVEAALTALGGRDPWTKIGFFLNGNLRLGGRSALEALREGDVEAVVSAASKHATHGAA